MCSLSSAALWQLKESSFSERRFFLHKFHREKCVFSSRGLLSLGSDKFQFREIIPLLKLSQIFVKNLSKGISREREGERERERERGRERDLKNLMKAAFSE